MAIVSKRTALLGVGVLLLALPIAAERAVYRLDVDNTWSEATHPGAFPPDAHFSWFGGGTHGAAVTFWDEGLLASPGMTQMAETGVTDVLLDEVEAAITAGTADGELSWQHWFCPSGTSHPACGSTTVDFLIDESFSLVTLVSMLGPSPDWFIGVSGLPLRTGGAWIPSVVVDLFPYDGGTRDANVFQLFGPLTDPQEPVTRITTESGQLIGPDSLGTMTFTYLPEPGAPVALFVALAGLVGLEATRRRAAAHRRRDPR